MNKLNKAFAPLGEEVTLAPMPSELSDGVEILPAPTEPARPAHATAMWVYRTPEGQPFHAKYRSEKPGGGKTYSQKTYGMLDGLKQWHPKATAGRPPLYNLDRLAASPDAPVLLVEGEKAADAAGLLFHGQVATTAGSAVSMGRADYAPLAGRDVVIWPDHDEPGQKAAQQATKRLHEAGVASLRIVSVPGTFPKAWDLADDAPDGTDLRALLDEAPTVARVQMPGGFAMKADGLFYTPPGDSDKPPVRVSAPFEIVAQTRDTNGENWGLLLQWKDHDGKPHEWAIPYSKMHGDAREISGVLHEQGLRCLPNAARLLQTFLATVETDARLACVRQPGWHATDRGPVFVLANGAKIGPGAGSVTLQAGRASSGDKFAVSGTLDGWKDDVARYAIGNSRLAFYISAALAGPLLDIATEQSGGFHLVGGARSGKSTAAYAAGSVWGPTGQVRAWRATANGLEGIAAEISDTVLILDEIGQASDFEVGNIVYSLSNEAGKQRANQRGGARSAFTWRTLFLSTGECTLEDKQNEAGKKTMAGQKTRLANIPAAPEGGHGLFETLHGFSDGAALSNHLRRAVHRQHGTASRAFLARLTSARALDEAEVRQWIDGRRKAFVAEHAKDAGSQAQSVAGRFALVACAGELAARFNVVPWPEDEATNAAAVCFKAWLAENGSGDAFEEQAAIEQVRAFIAAHGDSRFQAIGSDGGVDMNADSRVAVANRAGFRWLCGGSVECFGILPTAFVNEVCRGINARRAADILAKAGHLILSRSGKTKSFRRVPGYSSGMPFYLIRPSILA